MEDLLALVVFLSEHQILVLKVLEVSEELLRVLLDDLGLAALKGRLYVHHLVFELADPGDYGPEGGGYFFFSSTTSMSE